MIRRMCTRITALGWFLVAIRYYVMDFKELVGWQNVLGGILILFALFMSAFAMEVFDAESVDD